MKSSKNVVFGSPTFKGMGYPRFRTCIFKSRSLPSMQPVLVEFRSASAEWLTKKEEESVLKRKFNIILRPNKANRYLRVADLFKISDSVLNISCQSSLRRYKSFTPVSMTFACSELVR